MAPLKHIGHVRSGAPLRSLDMLKPTRAHGTSRKRGVRVLSTTERMIMAHEARLLATYYYLKLRCHNSVLYKPTKATLKKLGISNRTYYVWVRKMEAKGMIQRHGKHWRLVPILDIANKSAKKGVVRHQTTMLLELGMSVRDIQDVLNLKIFEQRYRQVAKATAKADELNRTVGERRRNKILFRWSPSRGEAASSPFRAMNSMLKLRAPDHVPMSVPHIAKALLMTPASTKRWKRRMTSRGWISQIDRRVPLCRPTTAMLKNADLLRSAWSCSVYGGRYIYAQQPSLYKPTISYCKK